MSFKNFISIKAPIGDAVKVFGDMDGTIEDPVELFDPANETLAHLLVAAGAFPSVTIARKNGWNKPVPEGYSEAKVGKHTRIWIWNPTPGRGM